MLGEVTRKCMDKRLEAVTAPLLERIAALEAQPKGLDYRGVWQRASSYDRNEGATHDGSLWISLRDDVRGVEPGTDSAAWQLAVKKGRDARER